MNVEDIMTTDVVTIGLGHGVRHAAQIMLEHGVSGLPVVDDDGKIAGILTEGDLIRRIELHKTFRNDDREMSRNDIDTAVTDYVKRTSWKVSDCMSAPVRTVPEKESVAKVAALMSANDIKRLPVMRGQQMVGIVSRCDLLDCFATGSCDSPVAGDVRIRRAVLARLLSDLGYPHGALSVDVGGGRATVSGEVSSLAEAHAIRVAAESVPGIGCVEDQLTISEKRSAEKASARR